MALPLEVFADLQLTVDGEHIAVQADGDRMVVDLATLESGRRLLASYPFSAGRSPEPTNRLHEALEIAGVTLEVRLRGETIVRMGEGARPGRLGRLLNLEGIELRPARSLRAAARDQPVLATVVVGGLVLLFGWALVRLWRS